MMGGCFLQERLIYFLPWDSRLHRDDSGDTDHQPFLLKETTFQAGESFLDGHVLFTILRIL
jgi:hypothetical protein